MIILVVKWERIKFFSPLKQKAPSCKVKFLKIDFNLSNYMIMNWNLPVTASRSSWKINRQLKRKFLKWIKFPVELKFSVKILQDGKIIIEKLCANYIPQKKSKNTLINSS